MGTVNTNLSASAYQDLRNYIQNNYKYVGIVDNNNNEITRIQIGGTDGRAVWSNAVGANPLQLTVTLKGSDSDIPNPSTIGGLYLYVGAAGDTDKKNESVALTIFTVQSTDDTLTITAQIYLPATTTATVITEAMVGQTVTVVG